MPLWHWVVVLWLVLYLLITVFWPIFIWSLIFLCSFPFLKSHYQIFQFLWDFFSTWSHDADIKLNIAKAEKNFALRREFYKPSHAVKRIENHKCTQIYFNDYRFFMISNLCVTDYKCIHFCCTQFQLWDLYFQHSPYEVLVFDCS